MTRPTPTLTGLPEQARLRLQEMREHRLFTSDLSVSEFLLVREAGFDPLGLVMGTSIYQVAVQIPKQSSAQGCELSETTAALYHARELAMTRMEDEAQELGADGIIGVRLTMNLSLDPSRVAWRQYRVWARWAEEIGLRRPQNVPIAGWFDDWQTLADAQWVRWCQLRGWAQVPLSPWALPNGQASYSLGPNTAEFIAIGTAVRQRDGTHFRNALGKPFQSDLSGQDFWMLTRCGYKPVGFVMGNCVYYVPPSMVAAPNQGNVELAGYTHALYDARELAMERLQDEAEELGATGIVGVTVTDQQHSWRASPWNIGNAALSSGEIIELFVVGTAVVPLEQGDRSENPVIVLSVNEIAPPRHGGAE